MDFPFYQSHDGIVGMSDSKNKWQRLKIPANLEGKRVLDIGCNEGLLTSWCEKQGAASVIGIDFDKPRIEYARAHYASERVEFLHQGWQNLPNGPFDLVLWTSSMHYERDPKHILDSILAVMSADGLLILECGWFPRPGREMIEVSRHSDIQYYPTADLLRDGLLINFSVREVSPAETTPGDPVPRSVFHCRRRASTVIFVTGGMAAGKTDLVNRHLGATASKVIKIDEIIYRAATSKNIHTAMHQAIKDNYSPDNLGPTYDVLQRMPLLDNFIMWIGKMCVSSDDLVVIEGALQNTTIAAFAKKFPDRRGVAHGKVRLTENAALSPDETIARHFAELGSHDHAMPDWCLL